MREQASALTPFGAMIKAVLLLAEGAGIRLRAQQVANAVVLRVLSPAGEPIPVPSQLLGGKALQTASSVGYSEWSTVLEELRLRAKQPFCEATIEPLLNHEGVAVSRGAASDETPELVVTPSEPTPTEAAADPAPRARRGRGA